MAKRWKPEDLEALVVYFENGYTDDEIADALGFKDPRTVAFKRWKMGLKRRERYGSWTPERVAALSDPANFSLSCEALAAEWGVHPVTVYMKRKNLGLPTDSRKFHKPREKKMGWRTGHDPVTSGSTDRCSTN